MASTKRIRVVAALIFHQGRILVAERSPNDSFAGKWEFPGGKCRENETDSEALKRELTEELGVQCKVGDKWMETSFDYPTVSVQLGFYLCDLGSPDALQKRVHAEVRWATKQELQTLDFLEADQPVIQRLLTKEAISFWK